MSPRPRSRRPERARASGRPVLGLDLAGSPVRATGACVLFGVRRLTASVVFDDAQVLGLVDRVRPALVVIDAPLSLPLGRATLDDRSGPHFRECDRELRRLGIRFFPLTLGPMRMLTDRGMRLAEAIRRTGAEVLEGYPGGSQDLLGIPRKQAGVTALQRRLASRGLGGDLAARALTHDELDAVTLAWVGWMYRRGAAMLIGSPDEGVMVLPRPPGPTGLGARRAPPPGARFPAG